MDVPTNYRGLIDDHNSIMVKNHLTTSLNHEKIINKLTDIGLEVEAVKEAQNELSDFKIAKSS